jgi:DNA-binding IclR family transcriptional regulator
LKEDLGSSTKEARLMRILRAISLGKNTASQIAEQTKIRLSSLPFYLQELEKYDLVKKNKGKYSLTDKIVNDYFLAQRE